MTEFTKAAEIAALGDLLSQVAAELASAAERMEANYRRFLDNVARIADRQKE